MRFTSSRPPLPVLIVSALLLAPRVATAQAEAAPAAKDTAVVTDEVTDAGRKIFHGPGTCYACHGAKLTGGPVAPPLLGPKWRNGDGSFDMILHVVRGGVPGTVMVSHPGGISDAQVIQVATYVFAVSHGLAKP
ncbi:MAG TPA: cytochrome c [Gemmatimonadales bacterium]|nr:cytochrome c [Gemmatimonadales bacterium]